ncbi:uncharacterized protein LOC143422057 [Xylocopa sonorina]|uniref:uncharacterized protein LOC143422057 n=1 Tax=Xylocopa sonorina TaxID=1818115 RepID=UPI00403AC874
MSQVCPSSSHQLVAATVAFRRARRKFPKNFGLRCNSEETTKLDKTESVSGNEETNDQENLPLPSRTCSNGRSNRVEMKTLWNDECGESASVKENLVQKPIICSCCRKRNDQCSAGDTLDVVPSKEYNGITKKCEFSKSDQLENCDTKPMRGSTADSRNSDRCHSSCSRSGRGNSKETSTKLGSVNLLYDRDQGEVDNVKYSGSFEKRNCNTTDHDCNAAERDYTAVHRNPGCTFSAQKDNSPSSNSSRTHNFHCAKHSTFDLLRPHRDCCHQNRHRCCHSHSHCHHCCSNEHTSCSSKQTNLAPDIYLCSSSSSNCRSCCHEEHTKRDAICNHNCHAKETEKAFRIQEQNDEDLDDAVGTINHKDSLCILVEKYKTNKRCKHRPYFGDSEFSDERIKDESNKSCTSETTCQMDELAKQREKYPSGNNCRPPMGKTCRHGFLQIFREDDCSQIKNLKSRLIKAGTCCSAKGTPWRHTF